MPIPLLRCLLLWCRWDPRSRRCFFRFFKEKFARLLSSAKPLESVALMNNISYGECLCDFHGVVTPPPTNFDAWRLLLFFAKVHLHTTSCKLTRVGNGSLIQGELFLQGLGKGGSRFYVLDTVQYKMRPRTFFAYGQSPRKHLEQCLHHKVYK